LGVRGTDFFVADGGTGPNKGTELSVLRGEVAVKPDTPKAKEVPVKANMSAEIPAPPAKTEEKAKSDTKKDVTAPAEMAEPVIAVRQTTKEELRAINQSSEVKAAIAEEVKKDEKLVKKIEELEKKAVEATLTDIKKEDPALFAKLQEQKVTSALQIQAQQVEKIAKEAPSAPKQRKPTRAELENLEGGVYNTYFKNVE
jgi:flagellar biosynthesis GTPase FlhF